MMYYVSHISIHAPRVGRDYESQYEDSVTTTISIHAPRVGRDVGNERRAMA